MALSALVASHYTIAGSVRPLDGINISPIHPRDRIEAAAAAGFTGIGFEYDDLAHWLNHFDASDLRHAAADAGLKHVELEVLGDWFLRGDRRVAADDRRDRLLAMATQIGAGLVKALGNLGAEPVSIDEYASGFSTLCRRAASHGLEVVIELYPGSSIRKPAPASQIVIQAGETNGGLLIDNWHMWRGSVPMEDIAALAPTMIKHVELSDGPAEQVGSLLEDTLLRRLLPGEGSFPVIAFLRAIAATGYDGTYGVEIISETHRDLPVAEAAVAAHDAALRQLLIAMPKETAL
jgi:sugar phosphate isomerase/epimerase